MRDALDWRKSTKSSESCDCVEVRPLEQAVLIRDSRDAAGPVVEISHRQWRELLDHLKR